MRCDWLLKSSIFWVFIATFAFNVYANFQQWPVNDPILLGANTIFLFALFASIILTVLVWLYQCFCSRRRKLPKLIYPTTPTEPEQWIAHFQLLADSLPQGDFKYGEHDDDCNCFKICQHLNVPCRVPIKLGSSYNIKKLSYRRLTLTRHLDECNCACFTVLIKKAEEE